MDTDPFQNHDFSDPIPNPFTKEKAEEDEDYSTRTLEEWGMWKLDLEYHINMYDLVLPKHNPFKL